MENPYGHHGLKNTCFGTDQFGTSTFHLTHLSHGGKFCRAVTIVEAGSSQVLAMDHQHLYGMITGFRMAQGSSIHIPYEL
jgi:hypothetical protein